jgi:ribosomal protein S27AE
MFNGREVAVHHNSDFHGEAYSGDKTTMKKKTTRPVCGRCRHPGFRLSMAEDGRPRFTCDKCGNTWTCGLSGGEYLAHAMPREEGEDT